MNEKVFLSLKSIFEVNRPAPAQPGPTVTLLDGLFLNCVKRYELETNT